MSAAATPAIKSKRAVKTSASFFFWWALEDTGLVLLAREHSPLARSSLKACAERTTDEKVLRTLPSGVRFPRATPRPTVSCAELSRRSSVYKDKDRWKRKIEEEREGDDDRIV